MPARAAPRILTLLAGLACLAIVFAAASRRDEPAARNVVASSPASDSNAFKFDGTFPPPDGLPLLNPFVKSSLTIPDWHEPATEALARFPPPSRLSPRGVRLPGGGPEYYIRVYDYGRIEPDR